MKLRLAMLVVLSMSATPLTAQWLDVKTPGIPRTADGSADLSAPAPRTADGKPELTGLWRPAGTTGDLRDPTKMQAWVRTAMAEHERDYYKNGPHMLCLPGGPALFAGGMRRIVQSPTMIAVLHGDMSYRQIYMDGRSLEPDPLPIFMGYSVGRWDGDTLVVESNGFNERTWLHQEGLEHTPNLRITERYRRTDFGHMQLDITYTDPGAFDQPLQASVKLEYAADDVILELVCNEATEGGVKHWVGDKAADNRPTAVDVSAETLAKYVGTYEGYWLDNWITAVFTLEDGALFLQRNNREKSALLPQSETTFVCPSCQWGQPYVFTPASGDGMAPEVREIQVSGAWTFKRVQ
jgi:hypothetical protein